FSQKTHETTQRSFYVSPSEDPKVTCDAHHIVVGFEIQRQGNTFTTNGHFKIVDLFYLIGDIKIEFNSDNRRLYTKGLLLDV
ncbi:MAG: hypothetical protein J6T92_01755, partial [Ottowia sp.]|nr:hypothetical protein [Ottowia sp.]